MAESLPVVKKVWIEPGCIVCNACESSCPDVFHVEPDSSTVRPEAMDAEFLKTRDQAVRDAAAECPVEVIKFETGPE
jgi:ferredoxin